MEIKESNLFKFASLGSRDQWYIKLDKLAEFALPENWGYRSDYLDKQNKKTPILENYILHTFRRLAYEYNNAKANDKNNIICFTEDGLCFNTGLFTRQYEYIYAIFKKNTNEGREPWYLISFSDTSDPFFRKIMNLPRRAEYFKDIRDLIYDTKAELRVNSAHILSNPNNVARLPNEIAQAQYITTLFDGAINLSKKKVEANYKAAVPQFYENQICYLLPICLTSTETADLSLAVRWHDGYYTGHTCLTLDMAYNNARLIACPNSEWLNP